MTMTAPVVTSMAATGGGQPAAPTGFEGLFAALLGSGTVTGEIPADLLAMVGGEAQGIATDGAADLPAENLLQVGDTTVKVQGEQSVVAAFMVQVQNVIAQLTVQGQMPQGGELANALIKLGVAPEEAQAMAERIDTMMKLVKLQQDLDKDSQNSLEAMMLAAMMGGQQGQPFQLQVVQVEQTSVQASVTINVLQNFKQNAVMNAGDLARQMVGTKVPQDVEKVGAPVTDMDAQSALADAKADLVAEVGAEKPAEKGDKNLVVDVSKSDDGTVVRVALPGELEKPKALSKPVDGQSAAQTTPMENTSPQVGRVEKVLEKPEGQTLYKWQADAKGNESVQVVQPADESSSASILNAQQVAGQSAGLLKDQRADASAFSDRMAQAAHARVSEQVVVQIKPLADMGGGTVRMTLNPPELGEVHVDLTMSNGKVHGAISASDPVVVEQLARELHSLRHGLADAGLKLGDQGISLMLSNNGNQQQGQGQGQNNGQPQTQSRAPEWGSVADVGTELAQPEVAAHWVAPERVVDVRI